MARKYPCWTSEKDLMLLCAAHVHRDKSTGFVQWNKVAEVVAQGAHPARSCCMRHTHLIKNYTEAEKALRASDMEILSPASTPAGSPAKPSSVGIELRNIVETPNTGIVNNTPSRIAQNITNATRVMKQGTSQHAASNQGTEDNGHVEETSIATLTSKKRTLESDGNGQEGAPGSKRRKKKKPKKKDEKHDKAPTAEKNNKVPGVQTPPISTTPLARSSTSKGNNKPSTPSGPRSFLTPSSLRFTQQQQRWSLPSCRIAHSATVDQSKEHPTGHQRNNGGSWMEQVLQDFKLEILDDLKRQIGVSKDVRL